MNRRKALIALSAVAGFGTLSFGGWKWYFLTKSPPLNVLVNNLGEIRSMVDVIIPSTDIPGAEQSAVAEFVVQMIEKNIGRKEQNLFIKGLEDTLEYAQSKYGSVFSQCSNQEKQSVIKYAEDHYDVMVGIYGKVETRLIGRPFFRLLKEYATIGYFTSENGATKTLRYAHIPGTYKACVDYKLDEKAWATR